MIDYRDLAGLCMKSLEAAQFLSGDKFEQNIAPWRELVTCYAKAQGISTADTVYTFVCDLKTAGKLDGHAAMWLLAVFALEAFEATEEHR